MPSLTAPLIATILALGALASQTAPDDMQDNRQRLEASRRELLADVQDKAWMQDSTRATIARVQIEQHWKACAENEAMALARNSERPARRLAEAALATCRPWQAALELALQRGAYPYVEGPDASGLVSREDMVTAVQIESRDAALDRILFWRGAARAPGGGSAQRQPRADPGLGAVNSPAPVPDRLAPPEPPPPPEPAATPGEEPAIIVTAQLRGGCRVRLADRTLTEKELAAKAREWLANGTALKVVRPRGADYRCMAKIAWQLGKHGLSLFQFVEASEVAGPADPKRE